MLLLPGAALARQIYIKYKLSRIMLFILRLIFFATLSGKNTDSALPLVNILEMLTVAITYIASMLSNLYMRGTKVFCQNS